MNIDGQPVVPDYTLLKRIGSGSYGEVWLARNATGSYRAVKVVYRATFDADKPYEREFTGIKEFEPISRLHPSQVDILHVGRNDAAGYFYYVMELADDANAECGVRNAKSLGAEKEKGGKGAEENDKAGGEISLSPFHLFSSSSSGTATRRRIDPETYEPTTLRTVLKDQGRLPVCQCLDIAAALAEALHHLHAHGLVHRDIKPSNIIFVNGRPKLADIGLVARADATLSFVGTEGYLPPEGPGKPQADIYSFGKVLYEMASGKDRNKFPEPPTLLKELPDREAFQELNEVILKACAHDATERYQSAAEMQAELVSLRAGKSLKRSRLLERRLAQLTKLSIAGVTLTALVIAGYFYQQYQTRVARKLARQNDLQIAQLHEDKGLRLMEEGDLIGSLPWFAEALGRSQGDAEAERRHRLQIGTILQQCPRLLQFIHEPGFVTGAEFCADGRRVVTTGKLTNQHQYISEWNLADGSLMRRIDTGLTCVGPNVRMSLSPDDTRVVAWSSRPESREAFVYDLRTGGRIGKPLAHEGGIVQATFSPDGRLVLTASDDRTARLWNPDTGECVTTMEHSASVRSAVMDSAGETILTVCEDGRAHLWNAQTGQQMTEMNLGTKVTQRSDHATEFSPDGQRAVVAADNEAQVWDVRKGKRLTTVKTTGLAYVAVQFCPDGELILTSGFDEKPSRTAQVWEAAIGEPVTPALNKRLGWWATFRFSPDGSHVLSGGEGLVTTMWDARSGENVWPPLPANSQLAWFGNGVRFSPDGRMALIVSRSVQVWDMTDAPSGLPFVRHKGSVRALAFSPDGQWLVSASEDRTARVWDAKTALPVSPPLHHNGAVVQARFTGDGARVLTASDDGTAQLWNAKTGEKIFPPLQHGAPVREAKFSSDGKWIMTVARPMDQGGDGLVRLWDSATGVAAGEEIDHGDKSRLIAEFTPDGRRVITTSGSTARSWRVPTGERIGEAIKWPLQSISAGTLDVRFSPDGKKVLVCRGFDGAQVLSAETFETITPRLSHNDKRVVQGSWSLDGMKVVTVCDDDPSARVWDATTGRQLLPAMVHPGPAGLNFSRDRREGSPAFSSDGRLILTVSRRNGGVGNDELRDTVYVWDANMGSLAAPPLKHPAPVQSAVFSPDGRRILTGGTDGTVRIWDLSPYQGSVADLKAIAQVLSGRRIVGTTIIEPVEPETLQVTFGQIRLQRPENFTSSTNDFIAWHRREAEDRARAGREFAARWHANQLKLLTGDTPEFRRWQEGLWK